jgi:predicted esterase YcpF (UPF0227 family)
MAKILFLHGLESTPGGTKAVYLERAGHTVLNPALPKYSFEESVAIAQGMIDRELPDVIVGSSRGGAVAMCLSPNGAKTVLVAPAWSHYIQTEELPVAADTMILHSANDVTVLLKDSEHLVDTYGATLIRVGDCHRMNDDSALEALEHAVTWTSNR